MEFKELEEEVRDDLGEELKQLAKDYMKDQYMLFSQMKEKFEKSERLYNEMLSTEITEDYLSKKGYSIRQTRDY